MEKQEYILNLPLTQIVLRKIAIDLWSGPDIINLIKQFRYVTPVDDFQKTEWRHKVEKKVKEKVSRLWLPREIRMELMRAIEPIGPEILKWKVYHQSLFHDVGDVLDQLSWTLAGTVDYRKTAATLIRQKRINIKNISRFQLACINCLDEDIPLIWGNFTEYCQKIFHHIPLQDTQAEMVVIWTNILQGAEVKPNYRISRAHLYKYAFVYAAHSGNKAATQYFFQKLTIDERKGALHKAIQYLVARASFESSVSFDFPKQKFCDVLCFLLSQMDEKEQMRVFKMDSYTCLRCFLNWPWQDLFMKIAELSWAFLSKENYYSLIKILANDNSISGCYFQELFVELFLHAPSDYRKYIMDRHWESGLWFQNLFYSNNAEAIKLVIRKLDSSDRQRLIIGELGLNLCQKLIEDKKWFLLELFIAECALSREAKLELRCSFMKSHNYICVSFQESMRFFHLIKTAHVENFGKRSLEDMKEEEPDEVLDEDFKMKCIRRF